MHEKPGTTFKLIQQVGECVTIRRILIRGRYSRIIVSRKKTIATDMFDHPIGQRSVV
jgi:hypothetical protein